MNVTDNKREDSFDCIKNLHENSTLSSVQPHVLKIPEKQINMPENNHFFGNKDCDTVPQKIEVKKTEKQNLAADIKLLSGISCSTKNVPGHSTDYLFDFKNQNVNIENNANHKFYGCKKRDCPISYCESFGLPDDPIFSESPVFLDIQKSLIDTDIANPWDLCVINLDYVDQPWLIEYPEVITPYWDIETLFPFEIEDIRQKSEPENIDLPKQDSVSNEFVDSSFDDSKEGNNIFTSTPFKKQSDNSNNNSSVVSTINIANGKDTNVNISLLKDQVLKALEEAIKKKSAMANIDMKIKIVADLGVNAEKSSKKSCVQVRINESIENESCQSSSSSKENYFMGATEITKDKLKKNDNPKELNSLTVATLSNDWQDIQETISTTHHNEVLKKTEKSDFTVHTATLKKASSRKKEYTSSTPPTRRNLRSANVSKNYQEEVKLGSNADTRVASNTEHCKNFKNGQEYELSSHKLSDNNTPTRRILRSSLGNISALDCSDVENSKGSEQLNTLQLDINQLVADSSRRKGKPNNQGIELWGEVVTSKLVKQVNQGKQQLNQLSQGKQLLAELHVDVKSLKSKDVDNKTVLVSVNNKSLESNYCEKDCQTIEKQNIEKNSHHIDHICSLKEFNEKYICRKVDSSVETKRVTRGSLRKKSEGQNDSDNIISKTIPNCAIPSNSTDHLQLIKSVIIGSKVNDNKQNEKENPIKDVLLGQDHKGNGQGISRNDILGKESIEDVEKRVTRSSHQNELSQSNHDKSISPCSSVYKGRRRGRPRKDSQSSQRDNVEKRSNEKGELIQHVHLSQDPPASNKDTKEGPKLKPKLGTSGITYERLSNYNIANSPGTSSVTFIRSNHEDTSFRRILRSSNQGLKENMNVIKPGRVRTLSTSLSETNSAVRPKTVPYRKRSVSVNFDSRSKKDIQNPVDKTSNSQASIQTALTAFDCPTSKSVKSPKISFDFSTANDSPRNIQTKTQLKGILKNTHNEDSQDETNKALFNETLDDLPKLTRQDNLEEEFFENKGEDKCLIEKGITSRIRVVISPLDIKEENDNATHKECPLLPLESPVPKKSTRSSNASKQATNDTTSGAGVNSQQDDKNGIGSTMVNNSVSLKDIKIEKPFYNLGDFVWAQVSKHPYWPAIICNDPISNVYFDEVTIKNKPSKMYYHLRFFGDNGRRSWVSKNHLMLYCSKQDLEMIANKLKSEARRFNVIRPYVITGKQSIAEKWNQGIEELESLKTKTYEEVTNHLVHSFERYVNQRREKRKLNAIDASSESESEEPEPSLKPRRKRFKSSHYPHVTADANNHSPSFDEINISIGGRTNVIEIIDINKPNANAVSESSFKHGERKFRNSLPPDSAVDTDSNTADKSTPRRSRRSVKTLDETSTPDVQITNLENTPKAKGLEKLVAKGPGSSASPTTLVTPVKRETSGNFALPVIKGKNQTSKESIDGTENEPSLNKKQTDEASEVGSKTSSEDSSSNPNIYSFEYQIELHKRNSLFNGLKNVKVCEYCLKQGDLYKCKGKCSGFYHLDCASKVTRPRTERRLKKREKSPRKNMDNTVDSTPKSKRSEDCCITRSQSQCQIITIKTRHIVDTPKKDTLPDNFSEMSIADQIDYRMKEVMSKFENRTIYHDITDSSSEEGSTVASSKRQLEIMDSPMSTVSTASEKLSSKNIDLEGMIEGEKSSDDLEVSMISENASSSGIKHVTADSVILTEDETPIDITNLKCTYCRLEIDPPCFACGFEISRRGDSHRQKCSQFRCGRFYHTHCLKMFPQTQWSIGKWSKHQQPEDSFTCPAHICHTCFSEELGSNAACRLPGDKLARCLLCPAAFHTTTFCIPAGSDILGGSQIVCPRHRSRPIQPINTVWCFICSEGGNLVCCDTCPTSVHPECQPVDFTDDDKYICEDCESGRFPLYDEILWVKLGQYRWWPAIVLFPNEVPENVRVLKHQRGDFVVRFFGTNDHYWVNKARAFLFQEGDQGGSPGEVTKSKNKVYETFGKAIEDASVAYKLKKEFKLRREAECINSLKPPPYVKVSKNKPVGNVKSIELDLSNATACECDPNKPYPCGPDSNCINRLLMTECDPDVCPAGIRCRNQAFQKREYPPMVPYKTQGRGWGLKSLAPIKTSQFVVEYVGELIDSEEYQRRIRKMHEKKEENYYFMTVDSDRMIDAGPKGNLSRFMNHSCNPNCVTQKWTVKGDTRVGLFAKYDIETGSELTFNYNLEVAGQEKKVCKCGAANCSGFIGVKAKLDKTDSVATPTEQRRSRKYTKKRAATPPLLPPCFICGRKKSDITCNNKFCNKGYHLRCLKLEEMPEASKYACPRHNCNICSNRTIRCCVKCINSFCPSHSEGNVRHDKFLGFVCRSHDPGISSTDDSSDPLKETRQQKLDRKRRLSYCNSQKQHKKLAAIDRKTLRAVWRKQRKTKLRKKCDSALQSVGTPDLAKLKTTKDNMKKVALNRKNQNCRSKSTMKGFKGRRVSRGISSMNVKEKEAIRARWRASKRKSRLKLKMKILGTDNEVVHDQNSSGTTTSENNTSSILDILVVQKTSSAAEEGIHADTSETNIGSSDAERSQFQTFKSTKKRRPKLDPTEESAVSSTTSEEGLSSKPGTSKISRGHTSDADKDDRVSSSPTKHTQETSHDTSDDEISLDKRLRKSNVKNPRKKTKFSVSRLSSTAKPS